MSLIEVDVYDRFEDFKDAIKGFHFDSGLETPFLQPSWMENWWKLFGKGKTLHLMVFRESEEIVGFAPFYYHPHFPDIHEFNFIGIRNSNYLGLACKNGSERAILEAMWNHLRRFKVPVIIKLMDISTSSRIYPILMEEVKSSNEASRFLLYPCPYAELGETWEGFFKRVITKSKHRTEMLRMMTRLSSIGNVEFVVIDNHDALKGLTNFYTQLSELHARRFANTLNPSLQGINLQFMEAVSEELIGKDLIISLLLLDNEIISFIICFNTADALIDYIPAFAPEFSKLYLGHVHLMYLMRWGIKNRFRIFDFSKGDDEYKFKWSTGELRNYLFIFHFNSSLLSCIYQKLEDMKLNILLWGRNLGYNAKLKKIAARLKKIFLKPANLERKSPLENTARNNNHTLNCAFTYGNFKHLPRSVVRGLIEYRYYHPKDDLRLQIGHKLAIIHNSTLDKRIEFRIPKL